MEIWKTDDYMLREADEEQIEITRHVLRQCMAKMNNAFKVSIKGWVKLFPALSYVLYRFIVAKLETSDHPTGSDSHKCFWNEATYDIAVVDWNSHSRLLKDFP